MGPYEEEINKIKDRLTQIETEISQPNVDKIALKNEYEELLKKLNYLEMAAIREILIKEFYASAEALEKAKKNLEEAGIVLEQEEKAKKSNSVSTSANSSGLLPLVALAGITFFLLKK